MARGAAAAAATRAAIAAAPEPPARSRIKASPLVLLRNPPGPGPLLDLLSPLLVTSPPARPGPPPLPGGNREQTGRQGGREVGRKESGRKGGEPTRRCFASLSRDSRSGLPGERAGGWLLLSTYPPQPSVLCPGRQRHDTRGKVAAVLRRRHRAAAMCVRHVDGITGELR